MDIFVTALECRCRRQIDVTAEVSGDAHGLEHRRFGGERLMGTHLIRCMGSLNVIRIMPGHKLTACDTGKRCMHHGTLWCCDLPAGLGFLARQLHRAREVQVRFEAIRLGCIYSWSLIFSPSAFKSR